MSLLNETDPTSRRAGLPSWLARRAIIDPKFMVVDGHATKQQIEIRLPMSIGREAGSGLVIAHPLVSRQHCTITRRDDYLFVKDHGSANGTSVNGRKITESYLKPGDKLTVGPLTFVTTYQQSGPMSSRQLARKLANEVRRRKGMPQLPEAAPQKALAKGEKVAPEHDVNADIDLAEFLKEAVHLSKANVVDGKHDGEIAEEPTTEEAMDIARVAAEEFGTEEEIDEQFGLFFAWAAKMAASAKRKAAREAAEELSRRESMIDPVPTVKPQPAKGPQPGQGPPGRPQTAAETAATLAAMKNRGKAKSSAPQQGSDADMIEDLLSQDFVPSKGVGDDVLAGKTLLGSSMPKESSMLDVTVKLEQKKAPRRLPAATDATSVPEDQLERVGGYVLGQIVQLQHQILEHYQEAVITSQLVARLQQDQLDVIREEMDHLHRLTDVLKVELHRRHPALKIEPASSAASIASLLKGEGDADDGRGDGGKSTNLEHMHAWLLERMGKMQRQNLAQWQEVTGFLRNEGVDLDDR